jgi:hypothetical protein
MSFNDLQIKLNSIINSSCERGECFLTLLKDFLKNSIDSNAKKSSTSLEDNLKKLDLFENCINSYLNSINQQHKKNLIIRSTQTKNFEYKFFKLIKFVLIEYQNNNLKDLTLNNFFLLVIYCLNKSTYQYNLFKLNDVSQTNLDLDDELNIIEL